MEIKINELADSQQEVEVNLSYDEITGELEDAYKEERKNIALDGFRKGKVPMAMLKKLYGEAIEYKASEKIAQKKFWDVVDENNLKPISTPQITDIDFVMGSKLYFKVKFEIKPKMTIKDYKGLTIEKPVFKVKEDEVQKELDYYLKSQIKFEAAEEITDDKFKITANLQRIDDQGAPIPGHRSDNMVIDLTDEKVNPQIVANSLNKKLGDKFNFEFIDEHFHGEEKHREEYKYEVEVTKIEKMVFPEMTEELIKKISGGKASTELELNDMIRKNIEDYYTHQSEDIYTNALLGEVVKNNDFTPPPGYVQTVHRRMIDMEKENAKRYGSKQFDEKAVSEYLKPRSEWNAKWQIISENLAAQENITVDDSELEEMAKKESEKTGISVDKLVKYYKDAGQNEMLLEEKIIKFLKEQNPPKEVDADEKKKENKEG